VAAFSLYLPAFYHFSTGIKDEKLENFTEADYDFSGIKSEELTACYLYEYARESRAAIKAANSLRKQIKDNNGKPNTLNFEPPGITQIQGYTRVPVEKPSTSSSIPWGVHPMV
jgi:hypothetical protein